MVVMEKTPPTARGNKTKNEKKNSYALLRRLYLGYFGPDFSCSLGRPRPARPGPPDRSTNRPEHKNLRPHRRTLALRDFCRGKKNHDRAGGYSSPARKRRH